MTELRSEADAEEDRIRSLRPSFRATCHHLTRSCCLVWSCYCVCVCGGGGGACACVYVRETEIEREWERERESVS